MNENKKQANEIEVNIWHGYDHFTSAIVIESYKAIDKPRYAFADYHFMYNGKETEAMFYIDRNGKLYVVL